MQYDKLLESLRAEIKDKEREAHAIETRGAYSKQEVVKQLQEIQLKLDFTHDKLQGKETEVIMLRNDLDKAK
jgi:hypothetical protein